VRFEPADVFGLEQRRVESLGEAFVRVLTDPSVVVRVFVLVEALLVTGPPDGERVAERLVLAGGVQHQIYLVADRFSDRSPVSTSRLISTPPRSPPQP